MNRLFRILTSKWTNSCLLAALVTAGIARSENVWRVLFIVFAVYAIALLASVVPVFRQLRRAWKDFPATPEYDEYARRKAAETQAEDKNRIKLE